MQNLNFHGQAQSLQFCTTIIMQSLGVFKLILRSIMFMLINTCVVVQNDVDVLSVFQPTLYTMQSTSIRNSKFQFLFKDCTSCVCLTVLVLLRCCDIFVCHNAALDLNHMNLFFALLVGQKRSCQRSCWFRRILSSLSFCVSEPIFVLLLFSNSSLSSKLESSSSLSQGCIRCMSQSLAQS